MYLLEGKHSILDISKKHLNSWYFWKTFLFSSPELKAQVSFSDCLSFVCLSVSLSVNFSNFRFFSRSIGPISTKLGTKHPWVEGIQVCSNEVPYPFPTGDNSENIKWYWKYLKTFSRTTGSISTKHGTKHPWVEGIQVCSNKGPRPSQRGDNREIVKLYWKYF